MSKGSLSKFIHREHFSERGENFSDIREFASRMYGLWEDFPGNLQDIETFWTLSHADDPLSWGDEGQTRKIYERTLCYYDD